MRKILPLALVLLAAVAQAAILRYTSGVDGLSATATPASVSFTDNVSSTAFGARWVLVRSRSASANACFYRLNVTTVVKANGTRIAPGEGIYETCRTDNAGLGGCTSIAYVCDTGHTATLDIDASN